MHVDKTPDLGYDLEDFGMDETQLRAKYDREHPVHTNLHYNEFIAPIQTGTIPTYWEWAISMIAQDESLMPGNDEQGNPLPVEGDPAAPKQEMVEMTDLDVFAGHLYQWHDRKKKLIEHFLNVPEGTEIEVQIGENDTRRSVKLEGDAYHAFRGGLATALNEFGSLPFAVMEKDSPEANALLQPADITDPAQAHGG